MDSATSQYLKMNCDQAAWLCQSIHEYDKCRAAARGHVADAARVGLVLDIMQILGFEFEDEGARDNVLRRMGWRAGIPSPDAVNFKTEDPPEVTQ